MNNARRKAISEQIHKLNVIMEDIQSLLCEEQEAFDNVPESLQETERAEAMQSAIENMEYTLDNISDAIDNLEEIV